MCSDLLRLGRRGRMKIAVQVLRWTQFVRYWSKSSEAKPILTERLGISILFVGVSLVLDGV